MNVIISRRGFLKGAAMFSSIGLAPAFLAHTAESVSAEAAPIAGFKDGRILVVVQLGGGNDGLNTLTPWTDDAYYRARPTLGLKKERLIRITDDLAANDKLADLMKLYDKGQVGIVQGVGYPNPDRSHFRSMEIWHTASDSDEFLSRGLAATSTIAARAPRARRRVCRSAKIGRRPSIAKRGSASRSRTR